MQCFFYSYYFLKREVNQFYVFIQSKYTFKLFFQKKKQRVATKVQKKYPVVFFSERKYNMEKKPASKKKTVPKKRGKIVDEGDSVYRAPYVDLLSERMALALGKEKRSFTNFSMAYFCSALAVYSRELIMNAKKVKADENDDDIDDDRISAHTVLVAQQNMFRSTVPLPWVDPSILDAYETDDEDDNTDREKEENEDEEEENEDLDEEEEKDEDEEENDEEEEEKDEEEEERNEEDGRGREEEKEPVADNMNAYTTDRLNAIVREACTPSDVLYLLPFVDSGDVFAD